MPDQIAIDVSLCRTMRLEEFDAVALTDPLAPFDSLNLADWCHVSSTGARVFQPDPQLRVEILSGSTTADVYYGSKIVR